MLDIGFLESTRTDRCNTFRNGYGLVAKFGAPENIRGNTFNIVGDDRAFAACNHLLASGLNNHVVVRIVGLVGICHGEVFQLVAPLRYCISNIGNGTGDNQTLDIAISKSPTFNTT